VYQTVLHFGRVSSIRLDRTSLNGDWRRDGCILSSEETGLSSTSRGRQEVSAATLSPANFVAFPFEECSIYL
jgi:hypothetical protein